MWIDRHLVPTIHQIIGACFGVIFCAWFLGATSEQVAVIRLPATLVTSTYLAVWLVGAIWRRIRPKTPPLQDVWSIKYRDCDGKEQTSPAESLSTGQGDRVVKRAGWG